MTTAINLQVYILSFLMLAVLYLQLISEGEKLLWNYRLFKHLILSIMFCVFFEAIGWIFDGQPGQLSRFIAYAADALLISCTMLPLMIWTLYVEFQINRYVKPIRKTTIFFIILISINAFLALSSPINNLYFYLDANNVYHRGPYAILAITVHTCLFIYNFLLLIFNWEKLSDRNRLAMLLFLFPPLIGFSLQMVFYGLSTAWIGVSLSVQIAYVRIQSQTIETDYLTGLYNRRQLDYYLRYKVKNLSKNRTFAGVMIDIDSFKNINDKYGHKAGDRALVETATALREFFRSGDFIARYGGDEFVVLFDIKDTEILEKRMLDLQKKVFLFIRNNPEPFKISISLGYKIFNPDTNDNSDDFLKDLDELMYKNKSLKKVK